MDIQTFSTTYWYIWFLLVLFIVIIFLLNGLGLILYRKRRREFLNRTENIDENNSRRQISSISMRSLNRSRLRGTSTSSGYTSDSSYTTSASSRLSSVTNPGQAIKLKPIMTTIYETTENTQTDSESETETASESDTLSNQINRKSDMGFGLEEFQRQALKSHNSVRIMYNKPLLKLSQSLNIYAQYWAEHCARTNTVAPSRLEWRLPCKGAPLGENIISAKSTNRFDGYYFTSLIMANGSHSYEGNCLLNEISTEVGFGRALSQPNDKTQKQQWIGVAHYYPYHQLTAVQS